MSIPAFDTQKAVKAFKQGGFNDTQAEAVVTTMNDVMSQNFATKADLLATKNDLEKTIDEVRTDLEKTIDEVRTDLEKKIDEVRIDLEKKIDEVRTDLEKKIEELRRDLEQRISRLEISIAERFEKLYQHLWVIGTGIVLANVSLVAAVVVLLR